MKRSHLVLMGLAAVGSLALATSAQADPAAGVKVGVLTCNVASGWGLVFGSSRELDCTYTNADNKSEDYVGKINKYGVDIGYHNGGVMAWAVFAPAQLTHGALAGSYGGVTASATVGVGAGANVLVGGGDKSVSLQPVSIEGNTGLNLAGGVASIDLSAK